MKSAFNSKNFIKIGSEMSSGDFVFFKDVFIWIKSEICMSLLATYCTIAPFDERQIILSVILESG